MTDTDRDPQPRPSFLRRHASAGILLLGLAAVGAAAGVWTTVHGISTRDQPTALETWAARGLRHAAIPQRDRNLVNPIPLSDAALEEGRMHWADHCALCHGNDGRGNTEIGRNLYPKAPDMTAPVTQRLSDGELFSIIKNGVRLTGMPAWGSPSHAEDDQTWKLVLFIRHLPKATPEECDRMKAMNPISPMQQKETQAEDDFLNGSGDTPSAALAPAPTPRKEPR